MFRFEHPEYLYFLALAMLPALVHWLTQRSWRRRMVLFGHPKQVERLLQGWSPGRLRRRTALWTLSIVFLIIAWANPQWGTKREAVKSKGIDVFIAMDLSQSMLAEDLAPNRLERAKRFAGELALRLRGNKIGLILFAGSAYLQVPLTMDYTAVALFLKSASPSMIPDQGTVISEAIRLASRSFPQTNTGSKALIIISDGENHEEEALRELRNNRSKNIIVFTIGAGTTEGGFIPVDLGGQQDFKRDESGAPVQSKLDEKMLQQLAQTGKGAYFNLAQGPESVLEELLVKMDRMEKREMEQRIFSEYESYFQIFLGIALLLLVLEWLSAGKAQTFPPEQQV